MVEVIVMAVVLLVFDKFLPHVVRMYGGQVFDWSDGGQSAFYSRYGLVSFPRSLFLFASIISFAFAFLLRAAGEEIMLVFVFSVVAWGISGIAQIFFINKRLAAGREQ